MKRSMTFKATLLASAVFASGVTMALADGLTARLNTDRIAAGDTVQLSLSGEAGTLSAAPDLAPLGQDFDVLGQTQSRQTQILNGARTDRIEWVLTLAPKHQGSVTIPTLTAGAATSAPLTLEVLDPAKMPVAQVPGAPLLEVTVADGPYYIQQGIPVTLRITSGPDLQQAELVLPQTGDYTLTQTGEDRVTQPNAAGARVIERSFVLQPQKSGPITLGPIALKATLTDPNAQSPFAGSVFDSFFANSPFAGRMGGFGAMMTPGRAVTVRSAPVTLDVKAAPAGAGDWFLPAKDVRLTAEWQSAAPVFKTGEAVTRKVRIEALGATDVQLPDLDPGTVQGARIYLDGSDARTVDVQGGKAAVREFRYSIVPTQSGQIELPEIRLNWFDTASETQKTAILPAETISVVGPALAAPASPTAAIAPVAVASTPILPLWPKVAGAALAAVIAAGLAFVLLRRRRAVARPSRAARRRAALDSAEAALKSGNPQSTLAAISLWQHLVARDLAVAPLALRSRFPEAFRLIGVLERQLYDLDAGNHSAKAADNTAIIAALRNAEAAVEKSAAGASARTSALRPLYAAKA
jgi:hypothetical protein